MAKYLMRISLTTEGVKLLHKDKATGLRARASTVMEAAGGKLEAYYFAFGQDDVIALAELPDNVTAASISVAVNANGFVRFTMTPLLTAEDMDKAIEKSGAYPVPGR